MSANPADVNDEGARIQESWTEWAKRMHADPDSPVNQLLNADVGLSRDAAFLITMMGKVHNELVDIERLLVEAEPPEDEWKSRA